MSDYISNDMLIIICFYVRNNKTLRILSRCNKFLYDYIKKQKLISNCIFKYDTTENGGLKKLISSISSSCYKISSVINYKWIPTRYFKRIQIRSDYISYTISRFKFISYLDFIDNLITSYVYNNKKNHTAYDMVIIIKTIKSIKCFLNNDNVFVIYRNNDYLNTHKNIYIITYNKYNTMPDFFKYMTKVRINVPKYRCYKEEYHIYNNDPLFLNTKIFNITI